MGDSMKRFPEKLWDAVNDTDKGDLISWNADGTAIIVDEHRFEAEVMHVYPGLVQIPSFPNFRRQLREYSFGWKSEKSPVTSQFCFYHENFRRGYVELLSHVLTRRKATKAARELDGSDDGHQQQRHVDKSTSSFLKNKSNYSKDGGSCRANVRVMRGKIAKFGKGRNSRRNRVETRKLLTEIITNRYMMSEAHDEGPDGCSGHYHPDFLYHLGLGLHHGRPHVHGPAPGGEAVLVPTSTEDFARLYPDAFCSAHGHVTAGGDLSCAFSAPTFVNSQGQGVHESPRYANLPPIGALQYQFTGCGHHGQPHAQPVPMIPSSNSHMQVQPHGNYKYTAAVHGSQQGSQYPRGPSTSPVSHSSPGMTGGSSSTTSVSSPLPSQISTTPLAGHLPHFPSHPLMAWCSPSTSSDGSGPCISGCLCHLLSQTEQIFSPSQMHLPGGNSDLPSPNTPTLRAVFQDPAFGLSDGQVAAMHEFQSTEYHAGHYIDQPFVEVSNGVGNIVPITGNHFQEYSTTVSTAMPCHITDAVDMPMALQVAQEVSVSSNDSEGLETRRLSNSQSGSRGDNQNIDFEQNFYLTTEQNINMMDAETGHLIPMRRQVEEHCSESSLNLHSSNAAITAKGTSASSVEGTGQACLHDAGSPTSSTDSTLCIPLIDSELPSTPFKPDEDDVSPEKQSPVKIVNRPVVVMPVNQDLDGSYFTDADQFSEGVSITKFGLDDSGSEFSDSEYELKECDLTGEEYDDAADIMSVISAETDSVAPAGEPKPNCVTESNQPAVAVEAEGTATETDKYECDSKLKVKEEKTKEPAVDLPANGQSGIKSVNSVLDTKYQYKCTGEESKTS